MSREDIINFEKYNKSKNNNIGEALNQFTRLKQKYKDKPTMSNLILLKQKQKVLKNKGIKVSI